MDVKNIIIRIFITLCLLGSIVIPSHSVFALGELMVAPTRVVLDNRSRSAKVNLINTGKEANTYRIQMVRKRMTETGSFVDVTEPLPDEKFVDKMVRFSPRQVSLEPGQSQAIRIIVRKPANLPHGEYRSHLLFRAIPSGEVSGIATGNQDDPQLSVQLTPILGVSIPVIVRHGETHVEASISELQFQPGEQPTLSLTLQRTGNQSVYGDFTVKFIDSKGESLVVNQVNGIAVYTPNTQRKIRLQLQPVNGMQLQHGKLHVTYRQDIKEGGQLLSEATISIP